MSARMSGRCVAGVLAMVLLAVAMCAFNRHNELWPSSTYQVLRDLGFDLVRDRSYELTFPLWGYPAAIALLAFVSPGLPDGALPLIQSLVCVVVLVAFVPRWLARWNTLQLLAWLLLLIPVLAFASLRLPDAIVAIALMAVALSMRNWMETGRGSWLLLGVVAVVIAVNMRSEIVPLVLGMCVVSLVAFAARRTEISRVIARYFAILSIAALAGVIPWMAHAYALTGELVPMSTNGPGWFYVGLGELPGNPWGLRGIDDDAWRFVATKGVHDPFSLEGSRILTPESWRLVRRHPLAYAEKVVWNLRKAAFGGVLVRMPSQEGPPGDTRTERLRAAASLRLDGMSWVFWTVLEKMRVYRLGFLVICGLSLMIGVRGFTNAARGWRPESVAAARLCIVYTVLELALVSFGHYEARFMTPLYAVQLLTLTQLLSTESTSDLLGMRISRGWRRLRGGGLPLAS